MSDQIFRNSLRANFAASSKNSPKAIPKKTYTRSRQGPDTTSCWANYTTSYTQTEPVYETFVTAQKKNILSSSQKSTKREAYNMHATCSRCREVIKYGKIYSSRCCRVHYRLCRGCFMTFNMALFFCNECNRGLYRENFHEMEASSRTSSRHSKCDECARETKAYYKLPCKCRICLECLQKETYVMCITDGKTEGKQLFIGCKNHGVNIMIQPVERIHKLVYKQDGIHETLACASCEKQLEGKVKELNCGHFVCKWCGYCSMCSQRSGRVNELNIAKMDIQEIIAKEYYRDSTNVDIQMLQHHKRCIRHNYSLYFKMPCKHPLCVACIEEMADSNSFSADVNAKGASEIYCICQCFMFEGKHIISLCSLQEKVSKLKYLSVCDRSCSTLNCFKMAIARVRDCAHAFCSDCIQLMLRKRTKRSAKIHKDRQFSMCNRFMCDIEIPCDELGQYLTVQEETEQKTYNEDRVTVEAHSGTTASTPVERQSTSPMTTPVQKSFQNEKRTRDIMITETNEAQANTESDSKQLDVAMDLDELPQAQNVHKSNTDIMACKTKSTKTLSERSVKKQIRYNTSPTTSPDPTSFELEDMARDRDTVTAKTNQNQNQSKSESEPTPAMDVNETESSEERNCLKNYPCVTGLHCDLKFTCKQQVFVTFRECSHGLCLDCLEDRLKQNKNSTTMVCRCGTPRCTAEIPVDQLNHYLQKYAHVDRGNTKGNADKKSSEHRSPTPSTGHLSSFQDQREILGIPNIGFTCYASCILQVLGQTPDFKEFCHQNVKDHVGTILKELLKNVTVGAEGRSTIDWFLMQKLMHKIFEIDRSFRRFEENDCHSFILTLLNVLRKEDSQNEIDKDEVLLNASPDNKTGVEHHFRPKAGPDGKRMATQRKGVSDFCPAVLFESRLVSKFKYNPCEHEETYDDQLFRSILVPVPNDLVTLKDGVNLVFKGEDFPDNLLPCRLCNVSSEKTVTTRLLQIAKAPKILMLQLARFEEVQTTGSYKELRKTSQQVLFEKDLTLEHCTDGEKLQYELYGVVLHTGSMLGGHYTSCVRKQETNRWFYCSDSAVREIDEELIFQERTLRNAYILFYSRKM